MRQKYSKDDLFLIGDALMTHRWGLQKRMEELKEKEPSGLTEGEAYELQETTNKFSRCASIADGLGINHDGAILEFKNPK